ncbi:MAG: MBL fold metallo-hydrolase [Clostridia bacterium]|nr:MBL fold metallo-hydrolase [Clostridia bacterium]
MSKFCSLFSSSSANSTYISSQGSAILVDAGNSAKQILLSCERHGLETDEIKAIFITHEHTDHVKGVRVLAGKLGVPVYATEKTLQSMINKKVVDEKTEIIPVSPAGESVGGMEIIPFSTPHDSVDSVGYVVMLPDSRKISICTDLGVVTDTVFNAVSKSDLILLESNHDINMLKNGPYDPALKRRILSQFGHLPNTDCAATALKLLESGTTRFVLGHLSKQNNTPKIAYAETKRAFDSIGAEENFDYTLSIASDDNEIIRI